MLGERPSLDRAIDFEPERAEDSRLTLKELDCTRWPAARPTNVSAVDSVVTDAPPSKTCPLEARVSYYVVLCTDPQD